MSIIHARYGLSRLSYASAVGKVGERFSVSAHFGIVRLGSPRLTGSEFLSGEELFHFLRGLDPHAPHSLVSFPVIVFAFSECRFSQPINTEVEKDWKLHFTLWTLNS